jgi:CRISPR-associated endonuclease/helicase Cas3
MGFGQPSIGCTIVSMNERGFDEEGSFFDFFLKATGNAPFPWQERLYEIFVSGKFPPSCSLPTGLGKTSVIAIWLLALAGQAENVETHKRVPRRLVYVVNRRTIVDQATREAEKLRESIQKPELRAVFKRLGALRGGEASDTELPLAISTLRGQFADNGEWSADPARPAIIVGTVDMIGSRLLFGGYGRGFKHRPLHAGFLGQDTLLVHDEAHLEPAFQKLLDTIKDEQVRCKEFRSFHVIPLTATPRTDSGAELFGLTDADHKHVVIKRRLEAAKMISLHPIDDEKKTADKIAALALERANSNPETAILVFVRKVEDIKKVLDALAKAKVADQKIVQLTGTLRGLERDALVKKPIFQRYLPSSSRENAVTPEPGTVFLLCTSAGEVGVDISADHLICDLTPFDSMAQRFGRVNRYGEGDARMDVVHPQEFDKSGADKEYQTRREKTLDLLVKLNGNGSPKAIGELTLNDRIAAFSPTPTILRATDILFDAWALTTIREKLPGRPPVADWLHGVAEWEPPETQVAWREEVQWIIGDLRNEYNPDDLLEVYPLKPHELLKDRSKRVFEELKQIVKRIENDVRVDVPAWIEDDRGVEVTTLQKIVEGDEGVIANRTVILPPFAGGLNGGMLAGKSASADDVADQWLNERGEQRRMRDWDRNVAPDGMRALRPAIDLTSDAEDSDDERTDHEQNAIEDQPNASVGGIPRPPGRVWTWYALPRSADDDGSRSGSRPVRLDIHTADVKSHVTRIVDALRLAETAEGRALVFAAEWHDLGKNRQAWQRSIWNARFPELILAKSGNRRPPRDLSSYRHEFGSLLNVLSPQLAAPWTKLSDDEKELTLHFIAAHHGRGRPHFPPDEAFDPEGLSVQAAKIAREVPRRFARLQRKYGRWGLAYLESILRAADAVASANPSATVNEDKAQAAEKLTAVGTR